MFKETGNFVPKVLAKFNGRSELNDSISGRATVPCRLSDSSFICIIM